MKSVAFCLPVKNFLFLRELDIGHAPTHPITLFLAPKQKAKDWEVSAEMGSLTPTYLTRVGG